MKKSYASPTSATVSVFDGLSFDLEPRTRGLISGESGSGKTTLLSIISGIDTFESGSVIVDSFDMKKTTEAARARFRLHSIGFVFQHHYLLQDFSALGNVMLPLQMAGIRKPSAEERARTMLIRVGLRDRLTHRPSHLSGGECQRVAIARALVHLPPLVLADEPTGALDDHNSHRIRMLLSELVQEIGSTLLIASHDTDFLSIASDHWKMKNGQLRNVASDTKEH